MFRYTREQSVELSVGVEPLPSRVVCLLPVRNAADDLPGFFASIARLADAVIALDDGSTDETAAILHAHPLVGKVLTNPRREGFAGWDDAANRNALLAAASDLSPDWIISIDADERIASDDAIALRTFLGQDALPGIAYGFRCYSMFGEQGQTLPNPIWVYRLFSYQPEQRFPNQALHFAPIPTSISRQAFLRTTFRIQHLGGMSRERRLARYEKYRQADPECRYWPDYSSLLNEPGADDLIDWQPRVPNTPVFYSSDLDSITRVEIETSEREERSTLGIVFLDDGSPEFISRVVAVSVDYSGNNDIEFLIVSDRSDQVVSREQLVWIEIPGGLGSNARKNAGLARTGAINVLFVGASMILNPDSLDAICDAHRLGYAVVTGQIELDTGKHAPSVALDRRFGALLRDVSPGITGEMPLWASYRTSLLRDLGGFDESLTSGAERLLALQLESRGYLAYSIGRPIATVSVAPEPSRFERVRIAFELGIAKSRFGLEEYRDQGEMIDFDIVREKFSTLVNRRQIPLSAYSSESGLVERLVDLSVSAGELFELFRPEPNKAMTLFGRPAGIALFLIRREESRPLIALVRFDLANRRLKVVMLPDGLRVPSASGDSIELQKSLDSRPANSLDRFTAHDLIGRPFQIEVDEVVEIVERDLQGRVRDAIQSCSIQTLGPDLLAQISPLQIWDLVRAVSVRSGVESSLSPRAVALGLLRIRALAPASISVIELPVAGELLDSDAVQMARTFLEADGIVRPATRRNRLRLVEWA